MKFNSPDSFCISCPYLMFYYQQSNIINNNNNNDTNNINNNPDFSYDFVWILRNCSVNSINHKEFIDQLGVEALILLLNHKDYNIIRLAISGIYNILPTAIINSIDFNTPNRLLLTKALIQILAIATTSKDNKSNNNTHNNNYINNIDLGLTNSLILLIIQSLTQLTVIESMIEYIVNRTNIVELLTLLLNQEYIILLNPLLKLLMRLFEYNLSEISIQLITIKLKWLINIIQEDNHNNNIEFKLLILKFFSQLCNNKNTTSNISIKTIFSYSGGLNLLTVWRSDLNINIRNNSLNLLINCLQDSNLLLVKDSINLINNNNYNTIEYSELIQTIVNLSKHTQNQQIRDLTEKIIQNSINQY